MKNSGFESFLQKNLPKVKSFHPFFSDALSYTLRAGGKHFRANLLLSVVQNLKSKRLKKAYQIALALECMHAYSLIHDDLPAMDDASLRRSQKTLHKAYDEATAILVGDALNTHAFLLIAESELKDKIKTRLTHLLAYNAGLHGMVLGQAIDCFFEKKKLDLKSLEFLHIHKTAKLIAASLVMGAVICECDEKLQKSLYKFGLNLGLLFQINDDILDANADSSTTGKDSKSDTFKNSFVNLMGLTGALKAKKSLLKKCQKELESLPKDLAQSLNLLITQTL